MNETHETQRNPVRDQGDLWSVPEVAKWLRISQGYMYELIRKNLIGHLALGNKKLIPGPALLDFYESRLQRAAPPDLERVPPPANDTTVAPANDDGEPEAPKRVPRKRGRKPTATA
jgi:excisionase family DNA binding protein